MRAQQNNATSVSLAMAGARILEKVSMGWQGASGMGERSTGLWETLSFCSLISSSRSATTSCHQGVLSILLSTSVAVQHSWRMLH